MNIVQMSDFDFESFTREHRVDLAPDGHKHTREGWINLSCPFCMGHDGYHLGFNVSGCYFFCWRCGWHPDFEVVGELLGISKGKALALIKEFPARPTHREDKRDRVGAPECVLPFGCGDFSPLHLEYLKRRRFNPEYVKTQWGARGTKSLSGEYSWRVVSPIYFDGHLVSYHSRDITGKDPVPHRACPEKKEVRLHKHCLYGYDQTNPDFVVVVEGITDVWRLGPGAVATFGIQYSEPQVRLLRNWPRVVVLYDSGEPEARVQARKLAADLGALGVPKVELVWLDVEDPDDLSQSDADHLMEQLR